MASTEQPTTTEAEAVPAVAPEAASEPAAAASAPAPEEKKETAQAEAPATEAPAATPAVSYDLESEAAKAVFKQIEFYFSDSNFVRDKFLQAKAAENAEGFVPTAVLLSFNRLKALTTDAAFIAAVMAQSTSVVVSEDGLALRRASPPAKAAGDTLPRSVFADGIPSDATLEEIEALFSGFCSKVLYSKMRRDKETKAFLGSVFVELATREEAEALVAKAAEIKWKGSEEPLKSVVMMDAWLEEHRASRSPASHRSPGGRFSGEGGQAGASSAEKRRGPKLQRVADSVVAIGGLSTECTREDLTAALGEELQQKVKWVDYSRGNVVAQIRFEDADAAKAGAAAFAAFVGEDGKEIAGAKPEKVWQLTAEEQVAYWDKAEAEAEQRMNRSYEKKRGRSGHGGRGGKRQRRR